MNSADKGEISDQYLRDLVAKWGPRSQHPTLGYIHRVPGNLIPLTVIKKRERILFDF